MIWNLIAAGMWVMSLGFAVVAGDAHATQRHTEMLCAAFLSISWGIAAFGLQVRL